MSHILINAATGAPVPLPHFTIARLGRAKTEATVHDFLPPTEDRPAGRLVTHMCGHIMKIVPALCGLAIITEEEFMARQEGVSE